MEAGHNTEWRPSFCLSLLAFTPLIINSHHQDTHKSTWHIPGKKGCSRLGWAAQRPRPTLHQHHPKRWVAWQSPNLGRQCIRVNWHYNTVHGGCYHNNFERWSKKKKTFITYSRDFSCESKHGHNASWTNFIFYYPAVQHLHDLVRKSG